MFRSKILAIGRYGKQFKQCKVLNNLIKMYHRDTFMSQSFIHPNIYETSTVEEQKKIVNDLIFEPNQITNINNATMNIIFQSTLFNDYLKRTIHNDHQYLCDLSQHEFLNIFLGAADRTKEFIMKQLLANDHLFTKSLMLPMRYGFCSYTNKYNEDLSLLIINKERYDMIEMIDSHDWNNLITSKTLLQWNNFIIKNILGVNKCNKKIFCLMLDTNYGLFFAKQFVDKIIDKKIMIMCCELFDDLYKKIDKIYKLKLLNYILVNVENYSSSDAYNLYNIMIHWKENELIDKIITKLKSNQRRSDALSGIYHAIFDDQFSD